jgi:hypothetical protein
MTLEHPCHHRGSVAPSKVYRRLWAAIWLLALALPATAQTVSVEIYSGQLRQIQETISELAKPEESQNAIEVRLAQLRASIPATEDIASEGIRFEVDNRWMIEEIDSIIQLGRGHKETQNRLNELEFRIGRLRRLMMYSPNASAVPDYRQERELLATILNSPEYRPEEVRESSIRRWLREVKESLLSLWRRFLPGPIRNQPSEVADQLSTFQRIVLFISIPLAIYLLIRLLSGYRFRRQIRTVEQSQEILGETITPDLTPTGLLERARQFAQTEEYRQAIRLSFIASILQMAQHKILTVHPTRTNRDYLKALPRGTDIVTVFSILTSLFEEFWYGERAVSAEDYEHFENLVGLLGREVSGVNPLPEQNATN